MLFSGFSARKIQSGILEKLPAHHMGLNNKRILNASIILVKNFLSLASGERIENRTAFRYCSAAFESNSGQPFHVEKKEAEINSWFEERTTGFQEKVLLTFEIHTDTRCC